MDFLRLAQVNEISPTVLMEKLNSGDVQVIDVRAPAEWKLSAIDGSINIPITLFNKSTIGGISLDKKNLKTNIIRLVF